MVKHDIRRRFAVAEDKLHVIHNGVDLEHFHPGLREQHRSGVRAALGIGEDVPLILFVGSGFERKGLFPLLAALAELPAAELLVVGKDRRLGQARRRAAALGILGRVHFLGGQADVRPYYGAADVFALPTLYDPFPNAVLEALACGLPVLTAPGSGAAELVSEDCGLIVDALDSRAQGEALAALLALDRKAVVAAARATASQCGLADMAQRLIDLYSALKADLRPV